MSGTISDSSGAVISGARVRVVGSDTAVVAWNGTTGASGEYVAPLLPIGSYDVIAEQPGFKKVQVTRVVLTLDQHAQVNLIMTPGDVVESVTVSGETAAIHLDTNTSSIGTVITPAQVHELPIYNNDVSNLLALVNGVVDGNSSSGTSVATWQMSINGSRTLNTEVTLDGTSVIENVTGQISPLPPVDALEEMRVMTSAYGAENGRSSGGTIAVAVRSGTNLFHGSLYEMVRNEDMEANNFFNNLKGVRRPLDRYNQFGGMISGPLTVPKLYHGKNRTFFLYNAQTTLQRVPTVVTETVPNAAFKSGDFSAAKVGVYDPLTGTATPSVFPNNVIPVNRIDPVAAKVMSLLPLPNASGTPDTANSRAINNYLWPQSPVNTSPRQTGRIDQVFNDKVRIYGSIFWWASNQPAAKTFDNALGSSNATATNGYDGSLGYTHMISSTMFADVRFGFYRWFQYAKAYTMGTDPTQALGIGTAPANMPPTFSITNWTTMGPSASCCGPGVSNTFQWTGSLTKVLDRHTLKTGVQFRKNQYNSLSLTSYPQGLYSFNGNFTNRGGVGGNAVDSLADFLLGDIYTAQYEMPQPETGRRNWNMAAYIQDDWKISARLTLNLGLRWEYENPMKEVNNIYSRIDQVTGQLLWAGHNSSDTLNLTTTKLNLGPRIGFAYSLGHKTVIRTAFGVLHSQIMSNLGGATMYPGFDIVQSFQAQPNNAPQPFSLSKGMPLIGVQTYNPMAAMAAATLANPLAAGASSQYGQVNPLTGVYQWNFGLQQDLGFKTIFEANYIGNHGVHLPIMFNTNLLPFESTDYLALQSNTTLSQSYRPWPLISATAGFFNAGTSSYNALQMAARRGFSSGFTGQVAYTWSKSMDDGSGTANFSQPNSNGAYQCQFCYLFRSLDRAPSNFDVAHRVSVMAQYRTKGNRWIRGFEVSPVFFAQTGMPMNISQTHENGATQLQRPSLTGSTPLVQAEMTANGQAMQYLTPASAASFPLSPTGPIVYFGSPRYLIVGSEPIGNLGRNVVRAPSSKTMNASFSRQFGLTERLKLQLRMDAFNVLNHVNFSAPSTSLTVATSGTKAIFNSPTYGLITGAGQARLLQLGARVSF